MDLISNKARAFELFFSYSFFKPRSGIKIKEHRCTLHLWVLKHFILRKLLRVFPFPHPRLVSEELESMNLANDVCELLLQTSVMKLFYVLWLNNVGQTGVKQSDCGDNKVLMEQETLRNSCMMMTEWRYRGPSLRMHEQGRILSINDYTLMTGCMSCEQRDDRVPVIIFLFWVGLHFVSILFSMERSTLINKQEMITGH